jgi:RsiW-degrading membrane proteinase PrsW (M82 family)
MMVMLHVLIALSSIAFTTYAYFRPSTPKLQVGYGFVGLTLATGVYLVWSAPAHMIEACTMGVFYLGIVTLGIVATRSKLAAQAEDRL